MTQRTETEIKQRVIVRVWPVSSFPMVRLAEWTSFGHVSLQTFIGGINNAGQYISFWRGPCSCHDCSKVSDHMHSEEEDASYCGTANIENTVTLFGLNAEAITNEFEARVKQGLEYRLGTSIILLYTNKKFANCTSLVYDLLEKGGLFNTITQYDRLTFGIKKFGVVGLICGIAIGIGYVLMSFPRFHIFSPGVDSKKILELDNLVSGMQEKIEFHRPQQEKFGALSVVPLLANLKMHYESQRVGTIRSFLLSVVPSWLGYQTINYGNSVFYALFSVFGAVTIGFSTAIFKTVNNFFTVKPAEILGMIKQAEVIEKKNQEIQHRMRLSQTANDANPQRTRETGDVVRASSTHLNAHSIFAFRTPVTPASAAVTHPAPTHEFN